MGVLECIYLCVFVREFVIMVMWLSECVNLFLWSSVYTSIFECVC